jgi:membrane protease YdiL (CAAX protease family)
MPEPANHKQQQRDKPAGNYFRDAARPLTSLVFVAPILAIYEVGVLVLGPQAMRNGADAWLRRFLELIGFGQYFLLPILPVGMLLAWHHMRRDRWQVSPRVLGLMLVEAIALAMVLTLIGGLQSRYLLETGDANTLLDTMLRPVKLAVVFCGAGVYEELLFRLMLMPALFGLARAAGADLKTGWIIAVVLNSLIFSLAHYNFITSGGESFALASFVFRSLAGVFFSLLFLYRGFGIAAGSHAIYDILVGLLRF